MSNVDHPDHYNSHKIEVIDYLDDWFAERPLEWNIVKYISRAPYKGKELEDLKKARWYLERRIAQLEEEKNESGF